MKVCQIATVGENIEWILKGLLLYRANKLVLVSTTDPNFIDKINEIKDRLLDPNFEMTPIDIEEKLIESEDPLEFISIFKEAVLENYKKGYQIEINATAGLRVWQLLGYFTKIQLKKLVSKFFIINKRNNEPIIFPHRILSNTEQIFIDSIGHEKRNVEELKQIYEKLKNKEVTLSLISKYLAKLREQKLILELRESGKKYFTLTELGKIYHINQEFYTIN